MPTKADADSAQIQRKAAVIDEIRDAARRRPTPRCSPSTAGSPSPTSPNLRAALRPAATDYKVFKNTLARRAASRRRPRRARRAARGPGRDRVRPPGRRRRGHGGQGAARLRQGQPEPDREGRDPRAAGPDRPRTSRRWPMCRPARAARPARRRLPGPARQGGRPVPGLHPQLRLRPQGLHRPAHRGRRGRRDEPEAPRPKPGRSARSRSRAPSRRARGRGRSPAPSATEPEVDSRPTRSATRREADEQQPSKKRATPWQP